MYVDSTVILWPRWITAGTRQETSDFISVIVQDDFNKSQVRFGSAWGELVKWNRNLTWYGRASHSLSMFDMSLKIWHAMSLDVNRCMREVKFVSNDLSKLKSGRCAILWFGEHIDELKSGRHCYIHAYDKIRCVWFRLIGKKHTTWHISHIICKYDLHIWSYLMIMSYWHGNIYHLYSHTTSFHFWFLFKFLFLVYLYHCRCGVRWQHPCLCSLPFAHDRCAQLPSYHGGISKTSGVCHGNGQALQRFWEGTTLMHQMRGVPLTSLQQKVHVRPWLEEYFGQRRTSKNRFGSLNLHQYIGQFSKLLPSQKWPSMTHDHVLKDSAPQVNGLILWVVWSAFPEQPSKPNPSLRFDGKGWESGGSGWHIFFHCTGDRKQSGR